MKRSLIAGWILGAVGTVILLAAIGIGSLEFGQSSPVGDTFSESCGSMLYPNVMSDFLHPQLAQACQEYGDNGRPWVYLGISLGSALLGAGTCALVVAFALRRAFEELRRARVG